MARDAIAGMFGSRKNLSGAINTLKRSKTYDQTKAFIKNYQIYNVGEHVAGVKTAKTWSGILQRLKFPKSKTFVDELGWICHSFLHYKSFIQSFILSAREFERVYLLGSFDDAERILREIESNCGCSLWLVERQFMLFQAREGFNDHKTYLHKIQSSVTDPLAAYIITMISNRLEPHVLPEIYEETLKDALLKFKKNGRHSLASLVEFCSAPLSTSWLEDPHQQLYFIASQPIIDRYIGTLRILSRIDSSHAKQDQNGTLVHILSDLKESFDSPSIQRLCNLLLGSKDQSLNTSTYIEDLNHFYRGEFERAREGSLSNIKSDPNSFSSYLLYARANACCRSIAEPEISPKSPAGRILRAIIHTVYNRVDLNVFFAELKNAALKLGESGLGFRVWEFAKAESEGRTNSVQIRAAYILGGTAGLEDSYADEVYPDPSTQICNSTNLAYSVIKATTSAEILSIPSEEIAVDFRYIYAGQCFLKSNNPKEALKYIGLIKSANQNAGVREFLRGKIAQIEFDGKRQSRCPLDT